MRGPGGSLSARDKLYRIDLVDVEAEASRCLVNLYEVRSVLAMNDTCPGGVASGTVA